MEEFFKLVSNFGFPIVVSGYLLFRLEGKMEHVDGGINGKDGVLDKIEEIAEKINKCCKEIK